jgi:ABC-type branched-subunit amino acid transport system ATPase component
MSILELSNLTKSFGGVRAVDNVSLGFEPGKITALIGPNGAGKTTIFNLICGHIRPDRGRISYKGQDISGQKPWRIARMGIGRLFQDVRLFSRLSVEDNILVAFQNQIGENPCRSALLWRRARSQETLFRSKAHAILRSVNLESLCKSEAGGLSYGQQKLLSITRLLAADMQVLLMDEPIAGLNIEIVKNVLGMIKELAAAGKTIVIIEHNMNLVLEVADWVFFMDQGEVVSFGLPSEVLNDPEIRRTYIGI